MSKLVGRPLAHQLSSRTIAGWRYIAVAVLMVLFIALMLATAQAASRQPTLGLGFALDATGAGWVVSSVAPTSAAAEAGVKEGDILAALNGTPLIPGDTIEARNIEQATQIAVQRPATGQQLTVGVLGRALRAPTALPFLFIGAIFFAVGMVSLLFGRGIAPHALALLCCAGAVETLNIPLGSRHVLWALIINGFVASLFFGSFAYLFLVFPRQRRLPLGSFRLRAEWVLLPALPTSIAYVAALLDVNRTQALVAFGRVIAYPYFLACLIGGIAALIASWRNAETLRERAQLRIVGSGTILAVLPLLLLNVLPQIPLRRPLIPVEFTVLPLALIPLAFGYAILRYQVMNMHLFVRRGLVYSTLGAIITAIYALALAVGTTFVRDRVENIDAVLVPAMVALVVILGDRLRTGIQGYIDRLFDRQGYDYRRQLLEFSRRMNGILDPDELAQSSVDLIAQTMGARHVRLYLHDRATDSYRLWVGAGVVAADDDQVLGQHHATITEVKTAHWEIVQHFEIRTEEDSLLVPLIHKGQPVALLTLGLKRADLPYSSEDLSLLRTVASQLAIATENAQLYGRMRDLYLSGIRTLAATVDAKDSYTHGHSERVASYARSIAVALDLPQLEIETIELAGLLHDIGKIGVPDAILQKPGRLDPDERTMIEQHADLGAHILSDNPALMPLVPFVRHHHERYDGRGYPSGLRGDDIPLGAAIICVADTYDTMTTDRPYRRAPGLEEARAEIARCSGGQFNPRVVEAFMQASTSAQWLAAPQQKATDLPQSRTLADQAGEINARAMRVVYQIAQLVGTVTDLPSFLHRVIDLLRRELGTKAVTIFLVDQESGTLHEQFGPIEGVGPISIPAGGGLVGWVADHQTAVRLDDAREDSRVLFFDGWEGRSELAVPLISEGRTVAVLNAESTRVAAFSEEDTTLLTIIAGQLAQVIEIAHLHDEVKRTARLDGLTGVANHRHFYDRLEVEIARAGRDGTALSLALLDVDGLKAVNDTHGHLAGDAALQTIARLLTEYSYPGELIARYGGDEFAVLFPGLSATAAGGRAQELLGVIRATKTFAALGQALTIPEVSTGIAALGPETDRALSLVAAADAQMYRQKIARRVARGQRPSSSYAPALRSVPRASLPAPSDNGQSAERTVVTVGVAAEK